ncbi:Uncharacterised protein [Mycobacterium tuberculosis]|nr:Uncharacterised protein [Mycobacterium tuberculosis]
MALTARISTSTGPATSRGLVCTGPGTTMGSAPSRRSSIPARGVWPHNSGEYPALCNSAATVVPTAPGPTRAMPVAMFVEMSRNYPA